VRPLHLEFRVYGLNFGQDVGFMDLRSRVRVPNVQLQDLVRPLHLPGFRVYGFFIGFMDSRIRVDIRI